MPASDRGVRMALVMWLNNRRKVPLSLKLLLMNPVLAILSIARTCIGSDVHPVLPRETRQTGWLKPVPPQTLVTCCQPLQFSSSVFFPAPNWGSKHCAEKIEWLV